MIIDLTHKLTSVIPVYPGDELLELTHSSILNLDGYNNHTLTTGMHVGTHIDSPMHLTESNKYISDFDINTFYGNGVIFDVSNEKVISYKKEYENLVSEKDIVLFYTGHDKYFYDDTYYDKYPVLSEDLASFLVSKRINMVGFDTPSPDYYPFKVHKELFKAGILIIENLKGLDRLLNRQFTVIALPLNIEADSSLARVIAIIK